jgi:hypothetical protein
MQLTAQLKKALRKLKRWPTWTRVTTQFSVLLSPRALKFAISLDSKQSLQGFYFYFYANAHLDTQETVLTNKCTLLYCTMLNT